MASEGSVTGGFTIPDDILNDLCSRFIINVPRSEQADTNRLMFQLEQAHWFYVDYYCSQPDTPTPLPVVTGVSDGRKLQQCGLRHFSQLMFRFATPLRHLLPDLAGILARWRHYKQSVPTCGAILLSNDVAPSGAWHVLLVQAYQSRSWGFPKGKCNQSELQHLERCAIREVDEEIGFDISSQLRPQHYLEQTINEQRVRLYIIDGVAAATTNFRSRTRNEIRAIQWFPLSTLSAGNRSRSSLPLYMVMPFVRPLKRWIQNSMVPTGPGAEDQQQQVDQDPGSVTITNGVKNTDADNAARTRRRNKKQLKSSSENHSDESKKQRRKLAKHQKKEPDSLSCGECPAVGERYSDTGKEPDIPRCWLDFRLDYRAIMAAYDAL